MNKEAFAEFAPEFNEIYKLLGFFYDPDERGTYEDCPDEPKTQLECCLNDEEIYFEDFNAWFETALETDKESLVKYLEEYYKKAEELFDYWEYEHGGFGSGYECFASFRSDVLYLCSRYYEFIGETKKKEKSILFALLPCAYLCSDDLEDSDIKVFGVFENHLSVVEKYVFADWQCVMPQMTYKIGRYYKEKRDFAKAYQYFELGASLKGGYDGRQSAEPFAFVGFNLYELGLLYYEGLGRKKNTQEALDFFNSAASNIGLNAVPVMGDIYFMGDGVEKDWDEAYLCYTSRNRYNRYSSSYSKLTDIQKERLQEIIDFRFDWKRLSASDLEELNQVYKDVIGDPEKVKEFTKKYLDAIDTIPLAERTEKMDEYATDRRLTLLRETLEKPTENTGGIPENLQAGDVFTFGKFNGEPLEWKALETYDDGTAFVISTKVIAKMTYHRAQNWLKDDFFNFSFTEEEKSHIINPYNSMIYLPVAEQLEKFEGKYDPSKNVETDFAKSLSASRYLVCHQETVLKGPRYSLHSEHTVGGIRPGIFVSLK